MPISVTSINPKATMLLVNQQRSQQEGHIEQAFRPVESSLIVDDTFRARITFSIATVRDGCMRIKKMSARRDKDYVDVVSELSYWQERFNHGSFISDSFEKKCVPVIKLACEIYLRDPHGTEASWAAALHHRIPPLTSRLNAEITKHVAQLCWNRLNESDQTEPYSSPRLQ
ncbi:hypothetical protein IB227_02100 [Stenotrophomonas sp. STM01]|nr:hypothetical protein [Stenotrophomonas sp. STM01]